MGEPFTAAPNRVPCPVCGHESSAPATICPQCGQPLGEIVQEQPAAAPQGAKAVLRVVGWGIALLAAALIVGFRLFPGMFASTISHISTGMIPFVLLGLGLSIIIGIVLIAAGDTK